MDGDRFDALTKHLGAGPPGAGCCAACRRRGRAVGGASGGSRPPPRPTAAPSAAPACRGRRRRPASRPAGSAAATSIGSASGSARSGRPPSPAARRAPPAIVRHRRVRRGGDLPVGRAGGEPAPSASSPTAPRRGLRPGGRRRRRLRLHRALLRRARGARARADGLRRGGVCVEVPGCCAIDALLRHPCGAGAGARSGGWA